MLISPVFLGSSELGYTSSSTCWPVMSFLPLCWDFCDTDNDEGMSMIGSDQRETLHKDPRGVEILYQVVEARLCS